MTPPTEGRVMASDVKLSNGGGDRRKVQQPPCTMTFGPTGYKRDGVSLPVLDERSTTAPYLWTPMPCPDCLKLAKAMRSTFAMEGVNVTALDAFVKERER